MGEQNALSALLTVFGVLAILTIGLFALAGALAYRHALQRKKGLDISLAVEKPGLWEQRQTLTTGDLVMDRKLAEQVEKLARQRREASHKKDF